MEMAIKSSQPLRVIISPVCGQVAECKYFFFCHRSVQVSTSRVNKLGLSPYSSLSGGIIKRAGEIFRHRFLFAAPLLDRESEDGCARQFRLGCWLIITAGAQVRRVFVE